MSYFDICVNFMLMGKQPKALTGGLMTSGELDANFSLSRSRLASHGPEKPFNCQCKKPQEYDG